MCLSHADSGSVSISDLMWEREVQVCHPAGVGGVGGEAGLSAPVI